MENPYEIVEDEFVDNPDWEILAYGPSCDLPIQHIKSKIEEKPLCGQTGKRINIYDLFSHAFLCPKCEAKYLYMRYLDRGSL